MSNTRFRVDITYRPAGSGNSHDSTHEVADLHDVGKLLAAAPVEWATAYLVVTALLPLKVTEATGQDDDDDRP